MDRRCTSLVVAIGLTLGGCGGAAAPASTTPPAATPTAPPPSATTSPTSTQTLVSAPASTPMSTLASTVIQASDAPPGAISITMTAVDAGPRFQPEAVSAKVGTVVFFLQNVPGTLYSPDHNMQIGSNIEFYDDGSVRSGQVLAATPHIPALEAAILTVKDLSPGTYLYWCSVEGGNGNHASFGMKGTLTITP